MSPCRNVFVHLSVYGQNLFPGVGRVFTWGYGNDGQLANNENKGRYAFSVLVVHEYIGHCM